MMDETTEIPAEQTPEILDPEQAPEAQDGAHVAFAFQLPPPLREAREHLERWLSETGEVTRRHWSQALGRAKSRLDAADATSRAAASELAAEAEAELEALETQTRDLAPRLRAGLQTLVQAPLVRAQEKGAALLLAGLRRARRQMEAVEANLEAARPAPVALA